MEVEEFKKTDRYKILLERLKWLDGEDVESGHREADDILLEILSHIGFREAVDLWKEIPKWYA
jgi:hypothetical protein